ncbi:DUF2849 domain-containing protein [Aliiroseovarius sp. M344]|uniref:DUF2849 domain-containing protein n=1 Tax=Aliiroseovarius sp. M344 TaxID=2867010 RepID=UPI0021AE0840|nr:DUF2849 domain-containing protein [Aliiroseovarius sp. M344]UWQ15900.1 DUF2849 domain-containing protein [Aliiroseovarius sp. M344]
MPRPFTPKVVTANDLVEGDVIYLAHDGAWVRDMCMAWLIEDEDEAATQLALAETQPEIAVGPYLAGAKACPVGPVPTHFREVFRANGPSNRAHGKQASAPVAAHAYAKAAAHV